ncbi:hypothetical protein KBC75_00960 [Candidatus Shapirobacteria bacterium]|nr:hypothetical protein [Candidatus Shapirobacteria bacterium]
MISSLMAIFGWYSARSFAGWFLVITGSVLLISKMKATDESPKQVNYILVTLKFFNLFVAGVLVFVCYFTVTMLYFPDLAFSVESMWNSWFGIFNTLDAMVIYCLVALGSANLLIIGEFYKQPKAGWVIWCCNILMGIIWIVMETPSNAVSLDSAMILLVFTTAFHTISSLTIMFTGAPETK